MKLFIKKTFRFIAIVLLFHSFIYVVLNYIHYSVQNPKNTLFIYGDSQTYQGLDLLELKKTTELNIHSAARHGAGIYDFNVFVNKIPNNSKVLLSISKLSQIRPNKNEANTSPLNVSALYSLYLSDNDYNLKNLFARGIKLPLKKYYRSNHKHYPNKNSIIIKQPISIFKSRYSSPREQIILKQNMYIKGVKKLINKGCQITFVQFPFHPILKNLDDNSNLKKDFNNFDKKISSLFKSFKVDTIKLPENINNIYHDYSHLNQYGASILTKKLGNKLAKKQFTTMYIVH